MAENSGNGRDNPFGNGQGATPLGSSSGGNNFLTNPTGGGNKKPGRDFTQEKPGEQPTGPGGLNMSSVPAGGRMPFTDSSAREVYFKPGQGGKKPFKLQGEAPTSTAEPDAMPSDVSNDYPLLGNRKETQRESVRNIKGNPKERKQ